MIFLIFERPKMNFLGTIWLLLCFLISEINGQQQCTPATATEWEGIPDEKNYDRNYSSIEDPEGRPLGFQRIFIPYSDLGQANPCIKVMGIDDKRVEIMAESNPPGSKFCLRDQYNRVTCDARIYNCIQANRRDGSDDSITFEFYCDATSCDESDVRIFYRFAVSPPAAELDPEYFCNNRNTDEYPSSLSVPLPPNRNLATLPPDKPGSATTVAQPLLLMLFTSLLNIWFSVTMY